VTQQVLLLVEVGVHALRKSSEHGGVVWTGAGVAWYLCVCVVFGASWTNWRRQFSFCGAPAAGRTKEAGVSAFLGNSRAESAGGLGGRLKNRTATVISSGLTVVCRAACFSLSIFTFVFHFHLRIT
jgi:hypothetical protein